MMISSEVEEDVSVVEVVLAVTVDKDVFADFEDAVDVAKYIPTPAMTTMTTTMTAAAMVEIARGFLTRPNSILL
jgi:hypothetical protein